VTRHFRVPCVYDPFLVVYRERNCTASTLVINSKNRQNTPAKSLPKTKKKNNNRQRQQQIMLHNQCGCGEQVGEQIQELPSIAGMISWSSTGREEKKNDSLDRQQLQQQQSMDLHCDSSTSSSSSSSSCSSRGESDVILEDYLNPVENKKKPASPTASPPAAGTGDTVDDIATSKSWSSFNDDELLPPSSVPPPPDALARILSSCSIASASEQACCPICLDPMTPIDHDHPLQCPTRHCHYNFCASCIHSLLSSSKDDFEMASDGNSHVKVYLNCPNCRADLASSIRDVLLLRKVDTVEFLLQQQQNQEKHHGRINSARTTIKLTPSQERTRLAMQELHVQEAVARARASEMEFWKTHHRDLEQEESQQMAEAAEQAFLDASSASIQISRRRLSRIKSSWKLREVSSCSQQSFGEEWGVEADLINGVHSSIRLPADQKISDTAWSGSIRDYDQLFQKQQPETITEGSNSNSPGSSINTSSSTRNKNVIDETLLHGLEACMTHSEQLTISHLLTTGEPDDLARAAHVLQGIEIDTRQGIKPADRQRMMNRRASVYGIVEEARQIHQEANSNSSGNKSAPSSATSLYAQQQPNSRMYMAARQQDRLRMAQERRELEVSLLQRASLLERCPLPVRMPKSVTLDVADPSSRGFSLRFCNDSWDGTVLDAYTRLNITAASSRSDQKWKIVKKAQTQHHGVFHVLSQGQYQNHFGHDIMLAEPHSNMQRVVVASVQGKAGRQGVMKGDVVTHIDGAALDAGTTVDDLVALVQAKKEAGQKTFEMVLNADVSIAEALKRRANMMPV